MFIDEVEIRVQSGRGGDGAVHFRREKYVPDGGPDGGDGGRGGDVVALADARLNTLQDYRYRRHYEAESGQPGGGKRMTGRDGQDLILRLPVGSLIRDAEDGRLLADLSEDGQRVVLAQGGRGGRGNVHFKSSKRQAPSFARPGGRAEMLRLQIELKLLADVGLVGFPNAGKSTLLSVITAARPRIADYPFTTLSPVLGIVQHGEAQVVVADIPGLIAGASEGAGLGHDFLRHIERTRLLLHLVDVSGSEGRAPIEDYDQLRHELAAYAPGLEARPTIVVATKADLAEPEDIEAFRAALAERGVDELYVVCAPIHEGVDELLRAMLGRLATLPRVALYEELGEDTRVYRHGHEPLELTRDGETYVVSGAALESLIARVNFEDSDSLHYFQRQLRVRGVIDALEAAGIEEGDAVRIGDLEFDYIP